MIVCYVGINAVVYLCEPFLNSESYVTGSVLRDARYLGPYLHYRGCFFVEKQKRSSAADLNFHMFKSFWFKPVDDEFRVLVCRSLVWSALASGLTVFVLPKKEKGAQVIFFTSSIKGEGKSYTAVNTSLAYASGF